MFFKIGYALTVCFFTICSGLMVIDTINDSVCLEKQNNIIVEEEIEKDPVIGEKWFVDVKNPEDPFETIQDKEIILIIIDVKKGWVRYRFENSIIYNDEREEIHIFKSISNRVIKNGGE